MISSAQKPNLKRWPLSRVALALACLAVAAPLAAYAYNGSFMRYNGDDYCYAATYVEHGFWETQAYSYLYVSMYNGNRYALNLLSSLGDIFGPQASALYPATAILLWVVGLYTVLRNASHLWNMGLTRLEALLAGEVLVFATLSQAPELTQILYWRTGMLTYLAPMVANTFLLAWLLAEMKRARPNWLVLPGIILLAIAAGGFSETGAALQGGYLGVMLLGILLSARGSKGRLTLGGAAIPIGAALLGTLIALGMLALSPINADRFSVRGAPASVLESLQIALHSTWVFLLITRKFLWLPMLWHGIFFGLLAAGWAARQPIALSFRRTALGMLVVLMITVFLATCCMWPSAYVQSSYPGQRVLITARFVIVGMMAGLAFLGGCWAARWKIPWPRLALAGALLLSFYPLIYSQTISTDVRKFSKWAAFWDARHQQLLWYKDQEITYVEVIHLDHLIWDVGELGADPFGWYNQCAALYYGLHEIKANLPGWDK